MTLPLRSSGLLNSGRATNDVLRGERLVDHVADLGAALEDCLRAAGRDRNEVQVVGEAGADHRRAAELHEARVEALVLEEALVHRDVGRDVQPDAAGDLADRDLRLGHGGAELPWTTSQPRPRRKRAKSGASAWKAPS